MRNPDTSAMWSHSLPAAAALALLFAILAFAVTESGGVAALAAGVVVSHVLVDYITGLKPTWPGGPVIGLDLYSRPMADFLLETAVVFGGWKLYGESLPDRRDVKAERTLLGLLVFLVGMQLAAAAYHWVLPPVSKCD